MSARAFLPRPTIPARPLCCLATSLALALAPTFTRKAHAQEQAPQVSQEKEPTFNGVGLILLGSLVGSVAIYPAFFGGITWAFTDPDFEVIDDPDLGVIVPADNVHQRGRRLFFIGALGLVASGAMFVGGIALHQRHLRWKERSQHRKLSLRPEYLWNGRTHALGLRGRF